MRKEDFFCTLVIVCKVFMICMEIVTPPRQLPIPTVTFWSLWGGEMEFFSLCMLFSPCLIRPVKSVTQFWPHSVPVTRHKITWRNGFLNLCSQFSVEEVSRHIHNPVKSSFFSTLVFLRFPLLRFLCIIKRSNNQLHLHFYDSFITSGSSSVLKAI